MDYRNSTEIAEALLKAAIVDKRHLEARKGQLTEAERRRLLTLRDLARMLDVKPDTLRN